MRLSKKYKGTLNRTLLHPKQLQKRFRNFSSGLRSKFLVKNFGCHNCPARVYCPDYPHTNGICGDRAKLYGEYFKAGKGEILPLLLEQLSLLRTEMDIEYAKCIQEGRFSKEFFELSDQTMSLYKIINKISC